MTSEEPAGNTTQQIPQDMAHEQTPEGTSTETQTPAQAAEGNLGNTGDDPAYNKGVNDAETHATGTFQKALDYLRRPINNTQGETQSSMQEKGSRIFKNRWDDDDTIENQMRNTKAQVVGTFKGLSSAFQNAGQKMKGGAKTSETSETSET
ncbi:unnamed protein product [Calypogeia fissa]